MVIWLNAPYYQPQKFATLELVFLAQGIQIKQRHEALLMAIFNAADSFTGTQSGSRLQHR